jgi:hypothetical protein
MFTVMGTTGLLNASLSYRVCPPGYGLMNGGALDTLTIGVLVFSQRDWHLDMRRHSIMAGSCNILKPNVCVHQQVCHIRIDIMPTKLN